MSTQPSVLQVVILRDGLLVGTEVFVPGQYSLGSGDGVDLRLDDAAVAQLHAYLYFQNGRAAIQDAGAGGVFVNGHRVNACEVRAVDEIVCGPFSLKVRVLAQKPAVRPAPPPEVAAFLGQAAPHPPPPPTAMSQPVAVPPPPQVAPQQAAKAQAASSQPSAPATVISPRRSGAAPQAVAPAIQPLVQAQPHLRPVETPPDLLEGVLLGEDILEETARSAPARPAPAPAPAVRPAARATSSAPAANPALASLGMANQGMASPALGSPSVAPLARGQQAQARPAPAPVTAARKRPRPSIPAADEGKGKPHLFLEFYWGDVRKYARSVDVIPPGKALEAGEDDTAAAPLWGFGLEGKRFALAEKKGEAYRVYVPQGATVERRAQDGNFYPVQADTLEAGPNQRRFVTLSTGHAVRLGGRGETTLVAYVQPAIPKPFVNPLKGLPWLVLVFLFLFGSAFLSFVIFFTEAQDDADFKARNINPVAVRLLAPPKPEEKKKLEKKMEKLKPKEEKKPAPKQELPKTVKTETVKVTKAIKALAAAGPAMKDLLAAVDKLGSGPGLKGAKDMKLSGLLGKAPISAAGIGSFGLGGGGPGGGLGIAGAELLRGKGGSGIGALGTGNIGKGRIGGTVLNASARTVAAQGTIDKDAVAKVINSHLGEVTSCYERALISNPGLAGGKLTLEWQITTSGTVGFAKTKTSTMKSPAVETCILASLKRWQFPAAKGAGVIITYPFVFNSVGY